MNTTLVIEIAQLAVDLAKNDLDGKAQGYATVADGLLQLVQKGVQAYSQHTGKPLDPSLITEEKPI
jgi:hypothetical protein